MSEDVERFIARWSGREGGQERANYALFLAELCTLLGVPTPDPADRNSVHNDYVFERAVRETARDGTVSNRRIDLYKRDCFVLEAKQSRLSGEKRVEAEPSEGRPRAPDGEARRGRRGATRAWDVLMMNARRQAEDYVRLLPSDHRPPPFVLVCDVGHCIEVYANFRRDGKAFDQFPDRRSFRIYLEDLRDPATRARLAAIWRDPMALDPARHAAHVTRDIAARLASVSRALEKAGHPPEAVAMFLMRVLFTLFAGDVDLLPKGAFQGLLRECAGRPDLFPELLEELWGAMDEGRFSATIRHRVRRFNGEFFRNRRALPLDAPAIGELVAASERNWSEVEPAIFGTLLEQALDPGERRRLGAHYTPPGHVERLVIATVIDPLRADWAKVLSTAERQKAAGRGEDAIRTVRAFHDRLCETRVLDPACGTANFLYVALKLMKRLEGEVLEALADLGGQEALTGLGGHTVDPHQFLGLEINPRAAAIAELVLWIGHLQWHARTRGGEPGEPILHAFRNIQVADAVLAFDAAPGGPGREETFPDPRRPDWPRADFIVGNPPFLGGKDLRARLGPARAQALRAAHPQMNESADLVMFWWDRAAELLTAKGSTLRRFGFVTTNSIAQVFQRRVIERHLSARRPLSIVLAIPDHPWTRHSSDAASVRIAMTVAEAGRHEGLLMEVVREEGIETDTPLVAFRERRGTVNADLTVGVDITQTVALRANEGLSSPGIKLHGAGFVVTPEKAGALGLGRRPGLEDHIRPYRNGRDLAARSRGAMVIDLFGLAADEVRRRFPEVYQHVRLEVKEKVEIRNGKEMRTGRDWNNRDSYRDNWWLFGEPRSELRPALAGLPRYIATVETTKHRVFQFLDAAILPDNMLVAVGSDDAFTLGVLSSRIHAAFALRAGGWLGIGNDPRYSKSRCFAPFPFPETDDIGRRGIRAVAEELDAHRKRVLAEHPHLTLTGLYNVLEQLRSGARPDALDAKHRRIFEDGLVLILAELHERLDALVLEAYGWPADLEEDEVLARLVALNRERAREEKRGRVRWLRPTYQIPRFGDERERAAQIEADLGGAVDHGAGSRPPFPKGELEQTIAVVAALAEERRALGAEAIARRFRPGRHVHRAVGDVLHALNRMGHAPSPDGGRTFRLGGEAA